MSVAVRRGATYSFDEEYEEASEGGKLPVKIRSVLTVKQVKGDLITWQSEQYGFDDDDIVKKRPYLESQFLTDERNRISNVKSTTKHPSMAIRPEAVQLYHLLEAANWIVYPSTDISTSESWKANPQNPFSKGKRCEFVYLREEDEDKNDIKCWKLRVSGYAVVDSSEREKSVAVSGYSWIDKRDGVLVQSEIHIDNLSLLANGFPDELDYTKSRNADEDDDR